MDIDNSSALEKRIHVSGETWTEFPPYVERADGHMLPSSLSLGFLVSPPSDSFVQRILDVPGTHNRRSCAFALALATVGLR